jgi:hypothetical protein
MNAPPISFNPGYVGVFFAEAWFNTAGSAYAAKMSDTQLRFPITPEEAYNVCQDAPTSFIVNVGCGPGEKERPTTVSQFTLKAKNPIEFEVMLANLLSTMLRPGMLLYSPHVNAVLAPLVNWAAVMRPDRVPNGLYTPIDVVELFHYPTFLPFDQRRSFSYETAARWLGVRTSGVEGRNDMNLWNQQQGASAQELLEKLCQKKPVIQRA